MVFLALFVEDVVVLIPLKKNNDVCHFENHSFVYLRDICQTTTMAISAVPAIKTPKTNPIA